MHYIPGCDNYLADFLSRSIEPDTKIAEVNAIEFQSSIDWNKEQAKDPELMEVAKCVYYDGPEVDWKCQLFISDKVLMHSNNRVVVPDHMKAEILTTDF